MQEVFGCWALLVEPSSCLDPGFGLVRTNGCWFFFSLILHSTTIIFFFFSSSRTPLSELGGFLPTSIGEAEGKVCKSCKSCFLFAVHSHTSHTCVPPPSPKIPIRAGQHPDFPGAAAEEGRDLLCSLYEHFFNIFLRCLTRRCVRDFARAVYF